MEEAEKAAKGELPPERVAQLREELDLLAEKGQLTPELKRIRKKLAAHETATGGEAR